MKKLLIVVAVLAAMVLVVAIIGWTLPRNHTAKTKAMIKATPQEVWSAITDVEHFTTWRSDVKKVEILPAKDGRFTWREEGDNGKITFEQIEAVSPGLLRVRIADESLPFGGTWTYDIRPAVNGTEVTITEQGFVSNPIYRFMVHYIFGYYGTQESFLTALGKRFKQSVTPVRL